MDSSDNIFFMIFGVAIALGGVYGIVRGKLTVGLGDDDRFNRTVEGVTARFLSLGCVATGCLFFFVSPTAGIIAAFLVMVMTWGLGSPAE